MIVADLTAISTNGWYNSPDIERGLVPISTFGWYFDILTEKNGVNILLNINRTIELELER